MASPGVSMSARMGPKAEYYYFLNITFGGRMGRLFVINVVKLYQLNEDLLTEEKSQFGKYI